MFTICRASHTICGVIFWIYKALRIFIPQYSLPTALYLATAYFCSHGHSLFLLTAIFLGTAVFSAHSFILFLTIAQCRLHIFCPQLLFLATSVFSAHSCIFFTTAVFSAYSFILDTVVFSAHHCILATIPECMYFSGMSIAVCKLLEQAKPLYYFPDVTTHHVLMTS